MAARRSGTEALAGHNMLTGSTSIAMRVRVSWPARATASSVWRNAWRSLDRTMKRKRQRFRKRASGAVHNSGGVGKNGGTKPDRHHTE